MILRILSYFSKLSSTFNLTCLSSLVCGCVWVCTCNYRDVRASEKKSEIIWYAWRVVLFNALKPQDSFGKKDKTLSWSAESAAHRQKTLINLPALVLNDVFSCNNVKWLYIGMYITYGGVFGGTPNILIFGLFLENESNLDVNNEQGIYSSYRSIKSCIDKQNDLF